ncbi:hypothetical protein R1sor_015628 [Riccia sorocarpa]|uniref:Reverse transcriptase domain-containing protein n=1 Tax=Riccia sorocarpa TaxID=122646 RepID=A0ABD3HGQ4_9MARC
MGFSPKAIKLIKGLAQGGLAKVHLNEDFTKDIPIQRGVRQGCSLAPYLFTLTTQILMDTIQAGVNEGSIRGIQIDQNQQLVHRLFADDTGLFLEMDEGVFDEARKRIALFETASGALLNVSKSLLIPMGGLNRQQLPEWLGNTGCRIAETGQRFKYLGLLSGIDVRNEELKDQVKLQYEKRLKHWSLRLLSWPERLLVIRSILRALPGYTLLSLGIHKAGVTELDRISRQFLWGWSETGKCKKSLLAWEVFSKPKNAGGLGWGQLETLAEAHLLKNVLCLMKPDQDIWTSLLQRILITRVKETHHPREVKDWTAQEMLLGLKTINTPKSDFTNSMLKTWFKARNKLSWAAGSPLARSFSFLETFVPPSKPTSKGAAPFSRHRREVLLINSTYSSPPHMARNIKLHESDGWIWDGPPLHIAHTWNPPTHRLKHLLYREAKEKPMLMSRWGRIEDPLEETQRWTRLWKANVNVRTRTRLWRFIRRAYVTNSRAKEMQFSSGHCSRCLTEIETFPHAFWDCNAVAGRRDWAVSLLTGDIARLSHTSGNIDLLQAIDISLKHAASNPAKLLLITAVLRQNWAERNQKQFNGITERRPPTVLLEEIQQEINALENCNTSSEDWSNTTRLAKQHIDRWKATATLSQARMQNEDWDRPPENTTALSLDSENQTQQTECLDRHDLQAMATRLLRHYEDQLKQDTVWGDRTYDLPDGRDG